MRLAVYGSAGPELVVDEASQISVNQGSITNRASEFSWKQEATWKPHGVVLS